MTTNTKLRKRKGDYNPAKVTQSNEKAWYEQTQTTNPLPNFRDEIKHAKPFSSNDAREYIYGIFWDCVSIADEIISATAIVTRAQQLDENGYADEALDVVFQELYTRFGKGDFQGVNRILEAVNVEATSINLMIGYLSATYPAMLNLPYRVTFFNKVESFLMRSGQLREGLLDGLNTSASSESSSF